MYSSKNMLLNIIKDCKIYFPLKTRLSYKQIIEQAIKKNYIDITKISDLSFYYLYDEIKKSLKKGDCYGKMFLSEDSQCRNCQLSKYCKIISSLPKKEDIVQDIDSYTISKYALKNQLKRPILSASKSKKIKPDTNLSYEELENKAIQKIQELINCRNIDYQI